MMPEKLIFEAFGPYVTKQEIDFAAFRDAGLFLIHGKTGSGKTTVLDAMTYALFGESSGGARGDITAMRSDFAEESRDTSVSFSFRVKGKCYLFERSVRIRRKRNGQQEPQVAQNAFYMDETGEYVPFFENPGIKNVRQKAEEILGLTYDQFRQVILLPQGQFEQLLVADSATKEEILVTLFNAGQWEQVTDWLCDQANRMKREKEEKEQKIEGLLAQFSCASPEELETLAVKNDGALLKMLASQQKVEAELRQALSALVNAQAVLSLIEEWEKERQAQTALQKEARDIEALRTKLERAAAAKEILPLRTQAASLYTRKEEQKKAVEDTFKKLKTAEKELKHHASAFWSIAQKIEEEASVLGRRLLQTKQKHEEAQKTYQKAFDAYMSDSAFALSETLREGHPCPVCGSTSHPRRPAYSKAGITAQQVGKLEKDIKLLEKEISELEKEEILLGHLREECAEYREKYRAEAPEGMKAADPARMKEYASAAERAYSEIQTQQASHRLLLTELKKTETEFENAMEFFREACRKAGFENDVQFKASCLGETEIEQIRAKTEDHQIRLKMNEAALDGLQKKLEGIEKPDINSLRTQAAEKETEKKEIDGRAADLRIRKEMIGKTLESLKKEREQLKKQTDEYVRLDVFARLLRGDKGVGLKRYILGVMLTAITQQANLLLKKVHDGRYQLFRTVEGRGRARKVGLDLEVFDSFSGEKRSVASLSGGEKFLVALALSMGLSAVVQAQSGGVRIDAMFIDEGFGSLDPSSIEDALAILATIRGGSRLVGIISHVQLLKENIDAAIEVRKNRTGSEIVLNI
ncbi:MAG: SMC family ATPase [Christensenella sp.]|nr:SMC family ATPase [Christensenella sp.]